MSTVNIPPLEQQGPSRAVIGEQQQGAKGKTEGAQERYHQRKDFEGCAQALPGV